MTSPPQLQSSSSGIYPSVAVYIDPLRVYSLLYYYGSIVSYLNSETTKKYIKKGNGRISLYVEVSKD